MKLFLIQSLRRIALPIFARINPGDITIRHHYTRDPVRLHSFKHKGYWYHGRNRERTTMLLFQRLIGPGDNVIDIGGHIGYMSLLFRRQAGEGHVFAFEPGDNNIPYIRRNLAGHGIELIEKAVGDRTGTARFFLEPLTGQNNSFVQDFDGFRTNRDFAFRGDLPVREVEVEMVRLDDWVRERGLHVDFVKIDVEGFEWNVLQGMQDVLSRMRPRLMVEVQANRPQIFDDLTSMGYLLFSPELEVLKTAERLHYNVFALHREVHRTQIEELGLERRAAEALPLAATRPAAIRAEQAHRPSAS